MRACLASRPSFYMLVFIKAEIWISFVCVAHCTSPLATEAALSCDIGLLPLFSLPYFLWFLSGVPVECDYSDACLRFHLVDLSFGVPSTAKCLRLCSVVTDPVSCIHIGRTYSSLVSKLCSFWIYSRSVLHTCTSGRMLSFVCEPCSLVYSPIHSVTAFGRVIPHFSVAKLVCSWVRLKALVNGVASQIFLHRACGFDGLR